MQHPIPEDTSQGRQAVNRPCDHVGTPSARHGADTGLLTREELAAHLGVAVSTTYRWQATRAENGFPQPDQHGRWSAEQARAWYSRWTADKRARMLPVDHAGEPDELVDAHEAGRILGSRAAHPDAVIRSYRNPRHGDYFPEPDGTITRDTGYTVPAWRRDTLWRFADSREHHGYGQPGRSGRRPSPPDANHPALPTVRALLRTTPHLDARAVATKLGVSRATAYRLLKAAKASPGDATAPPTDHTTPASPHTREPSTDPRPPR